MRIIAIGLMTFTLAACGGGSSTVEMSRVEMPGTPEPTPLVGIAERSNFVYSSRVYWTNQPTGIYVSCYRDRCFADSYRIDPISAAKSLSAGIEVGDRRLFVSNTAEGEWQGFGAWLDHSAFAVYREPRDGLLGSVHHLYGSVAFGEFHDVPLPAEGTATWHGQMVATDIHYGYRYAGDAELVATFDRRGSFMDVSFTEIANVDTGEGRADIALSTSFWTKDRFVGWEGHDRLEQAPVYVRGRLFGPDHAEAVGVFGYHELVGAFGARRVTEAN